jgi:hypothetical protein
MQSDKFGFEQITPNIPRLKHAIEVLERVITDNRSFNLAHWLLHDRQAEPKDEWCGTTACAMGYFALDKEFSDQGLKICAMFGDCDDNRVTKHSGNIAELNEFWHDPRYDFVAAGIVFKQEGDGDEYEYIGYIAATHFFGLDYLTAETLFSPDHYPISERSNPQAVIDRIQKIISRHENAA